MKYLVVASALISQEYFNPHAMGRCPSSNAVFNGPCNIFRF